MTALRSATELVADLRAKRISSAELLERYLNRIAGPGRELNAVVTLDAARARAAAQAADAALARGEPLGPLHGLPVTIKDCIETAGLRTTAGAEALAQHVPARDAGAVARLREAGAIVFGKTNLPEYARDGQTFNALFGTTVNPWDPSRSPGGSSGGSAAAVAAGLTALDLGSDVASSIRGPAHACGAFGLKPSFGLVPQHGYLPGARDMNAIGPLCRSADDLELALDVLAGPDARLPPPRATALAGFRLAAWLDDPHCRTGRDVAHVLRAAVDRLAAAGAHVEETAGPFPLERAESIFHGVLRGDAEPRDRAWLRARFADFFTRYDALLCPVAPVPAIPHDHAPDPQRRTIDVDGVARPFYDLACWASLASAAHLPAAAVPAGITPAGLPVGLQIVGPFREDRTVIDVARHAGRWRPPPAFA